MVTIAGWGIQLRNIPYGFEYEGGRIANAAIRFYKTSRVLSAGDGLLELKILSKCEPTALLHGPKKKQGSNACTSLSDPSIALESRRHTTSDFSRQSLSYFWNPPVTPPYPWVPGLRNSPVGIYRDHAEEASCWESCLTNPRTKLSLGHQTAQPQTPKPPNPLNPPTCKPL